MAQRGAGAAAGVDGWGMVRSDGVRVNGEEGGGALRKRRRVGGECWDGATGASVRSAVEGDWVPAVAVAAG